MIIIIIKQGYALKNWVEGLSDEVYYPRSHQKNLTKIRQPGQGTNEIFNSSVKLQVSLPSVSCFMGHGGLESTDIQKKMPGFDTHIF